MDEGLSNPYRERRLRLLAHRDSDGMAALGIHRPYPRKIDEMGPGMTAGDLDRMVRQHYLDGRASRDDEIAELREEVLRGREEAFDEGAAAQAELSVLRVWQAARRRVDADILRALERSLDAIALSGDSPEVVTARRALKDALRECVVLVADVQRMEAGGVWDPGAHGPRGEASAVADTDVGA